MSADRKNITFMRINDTFSNWHWRGSFINQKGFSSATDDDLKANMKLWNSDKCYLTCVQKTNSLLNFLKVQRTVNTIHTFNSFSFKKKRKTTNNRKKKGLGLDSLNDSMVNIPHIFKTWGPNTWQGWSESQVQRTTVIYIIWWFSSTG